MSLAVFDFDGTLIEGDAGVHFARHMLVKGYLDEASTGSLLSRIAGITRMNWRAVQLLYKHVNLHTGYRQGNVDRRSMVQQAYASFEGLEREAIKEEMRRFAQTKLPDRLHADTVERLEEHIQRGDHAVILSTGLHGLIWPLRNALGLEAEVVACHLQDRDGTLTGAVEGPLNGAEKATRLVAIARRRGHDLEEAYAYADHETDADMLEVVGHPAVVHPTSAMRRKARKKGWEILE